MLHTKPGLITVMSFDVSSISLLMAPTTPHLPDGFVTADERFFRAEMERRDAGIRRWMDRRLRATQPA
jgi:hypothetical protein